MRARLSTAGLIGAHVMSWVGLSPSFIPRAWWMTATSVGLAEAFGYGVGAGGQAVARAAGRFRRGKAPRPDDAAAQPVDVVGKGMPLTPTSREALREQARQAVPWAMTAVSAVAWLRSARRQAEIAGLMETRRITLREQALGTAAGTALGLGLIQSGRAVHAVARTFRSALRPVLPQPVADAVGTALWGVGFAVLADRVVYRQLLERLSQAAQEANRRVVPGLVPPREPERSGSPASGEPWSTLGAKGQGIVTDGPRAADIELVTGRPALTPIRAYAGWRKGRSLEDTAQAVVAELRRTGAFEREVLLVINTTGTGWLSEWTASAVEFLTGGNCALAALQYTSLPSGLAFVADRSTPVAAARALVRAIEDELATRPADARPRLLLSGESLGAWGGSSAYADLEDMLRRVDGALWSGMPRIAPFWRSLAARRRQGSPEILPVVDDGAHVRFAARPRDLVQDAAGTPYGPWRHPRVVMAQHPSDPVVWWSPDLLWRRPDWARERPGRDVSAAVRWMPWVTFWQVASDMPRSVMVPGGHGHRYQEDVIPAWAAILGQDPLADHSRIAQAIRRLTVPMQA